MVTETSRVAYKNLKEIGNKQSIVLNKLEELGKASNQDIADALNWPINRVTGRMKELRDLKLVEFAGAKTSRLNTTVKTWRIAEENWKPEAVSWLND